MSVPNNSIAKLMYYLNCLNSCLGDHIPDELADFQNYYLADEETKELVLVTASLFSPDEVVGKAIFEVSTGSSMLGGKTCEFYNHVEAKRVLSAHMFWTFLRKLEGEKQFIEGEDSEDEDWIAILYCNRNYLHKEHKTNSFNRIKLSFTFSFSLG